MTLSKLILASLLASLLLLHLVDAHQSVKKIQIHCLFCFLSLWIMSYNNTNQSQVGFLELFQLGLTNQFMHGSEPQVQEQMQGSLLQQIGNTYKHIFL